MTPERWARVKTLFAAASERPTAERSAWLAEACNGDERLGAEVARLLAADEKAPAFLESPTNGRSLKAMLAALDEQQVTVGQALGSYRVVRELGSGGMGTVYLAERDDEAFRKRVAVKVMRGGRLGSSAERRFRDERQILAELDHPNIARLVDGGTSTAGLPFLVMEHVDGCPIDLYCDEHRLTIGDRLPLFLDVCAAVQHAHQHLVVHRDIKSSNVLVTAEGQVKLLDFGIAKLIANDGDSPQITITGERPLTPESASPEQVRGDALTTASDIYQLGVLLYRLLTGCSPYRVSGGSPHELTRAICEQEPEPPSVAAATGIAPDERSGQRSLAPDQLRKRLTGDLDVIVGKALRKDPERRYVTVAALADDVRRHLAGLPVLARSESVWYRTEKWVSRHKVGVAALLLVFLSLLGGLAATTWQARVARAERERAARRFDEVRQLAHDFLFDVHDSVRELPGSTPVRALVVRKGLAYLDRLAVEASGDPALVRELAAGYDKLGDIQGGFRSAKLGDTGGALGSYRRALAMRESLMSTVPEAERSALRGEVATSHAKLGAVLFSRGQMHAAKQHLEAAVAGLEDLRHAGRETPELALVLANAYADLGLLVESGGDATTAVRIYQQAEALCERVRAAKPKDTRAANALDRVWSRLGRALAEIPGREAEALAMEARALDLAESIGATRPASADLGWRTMMQHAVSGAVAYRVGEIPFASSQLEPAISAGERLLAEDPENAQWRYDLALCYMLAGNLAAESAPASAPRFLQRALELSEPLAARDPADVDVASVVALSRAGLGMALANLARSAAGGDRQVDACREASRWLDQSGPDLERLERLQTLNGWKRWLAHKSMATMAGCGRPAAPGTSSASG